MFQHIGIVELDLILLLVRLRRGRVSEELVVRHKIRLDTWISAADAIFLPPRRASAWCEDTEWVSEIAKHPRLIESDPMLHPIAKFFKAKICIVLIVFPVKQFINGIWRMNIGITIWGAAYEGLFKFFFFFYQVVYLNNYLHNFRTQETTIGIFQGLGKIPVKYSHEWLYTCDSNKTRIDKHILRYFNLNSKEE